MGVVYRAFDPASQRQVALKVLLAGSPDRFEREGLLSARLDHPSIVRVHTSGVREGRPCLVYELVEGGKTLCDVMAAGCSIEEGVRLLRDAARGLGHAHARGILHRDVKPDNVLIDAEGRAKVADFGLAAAKGLDQLTVTGAVLGTPLYMAPETLGGIKEQVGPHTDVWALGAILYELLAGIPPFSADSLVTLGVQVVQAPVPSIDSSREVPPALLGVAKRALEKSPEDRYPDGDAFADDLDAYLRGELAAPRRTPAWLLASLAVAALVLASAALALASSRAQGEGSPLPADSRAPSSPAQTPQPKASLADVTRLSRIPDPLDRYTALRRWLAEAPPEHAQRHGAQRAYRRLLSKPLRSGEVGPATERVTASFAPKGRLLVAGQRSGLVLALDGTQVRWSLKKGSMRAGTLPLLDGGALWWTIMPLQLRASGPLGEKAPAMNLGRHHARYVVASPDSKRLAFTCVGPDKVLIVGWPGGEVQHRVRLPTLGHATVFDRRGQIWVGVGRSVPDSFTTMDGAVLVIDAEAGEVVQRCEIRAGSAPLSLAADPLSEEILLGLSSGDLVRLSPSAEKIASVPAFKEGDVLSRTFTAGIKAQVFNRAGDRVWIALNSLESESSLLVIDWRARRQLREIRVPEETESLMLSTDESLVLRGSRAGRWELWGTDE